MLPVLENIYQFRNAAAIIRSVEACGFHKIVALEEENVFNPNTRVARGADTWMQVEKCLKQWLHCSKSEIKVIKYWPFLRKNAVSLPEYELKEPVALIFGTEMEGVSQEVLDFADETLIIPMYGFTQSFNVSVAAAICMYELKQNF